MTKKRSPLASTVLLFCIAGGMSAWAAPTTTPQEDVDAEVPSAAVTRDPTPHKAGNVDRAAAADVPNSSNTIKMLLELQAAPEPGASASDSGRLAPRQAGTRTSTQTPAANPFGKGENPFSASPELARPAAAPGTPGSGVEWQAAPSAGNLTGVFGGATSVIGVTRDPHQFPAQRTGGSSGGDAVEARWWMPSVWVRWVREHRQEVLIGAAVALALAWAGASRASPRRR